MPGAATGKGESSPGCQEQLVEVAPTWESPAHSSAFRASKSPRTQQGGDSWGDNICAGCAWLGALSPGLLLLPAQPWGHDLRGKQAFLRSPQLCQKQESLETKNEWRHRGKSLPAW